MEPAVVSRPRGLPGTAASAPSEVIKSVLATARTGAKEEIFIDIVEKVTAIFDASGHLRSSSIVGAIQVKSYLGGILQSVWASATIWCSEEEIQMRHH